MRQAAKNVEPAMWDWDLATGAFHVSPQLLEIYGFSNATISFDALVDATHPQDRGWEDALRAKDSREHFDHTFRILHGETHALRWLRVKIATTLSTADPKTAVAYTAIVEDKTERIQAANALQESEERLRLAIEAGRMAVWEVDLETGNVTNSSELNLLFGFPVDAKPTFADFRARYAPGEVERLAREGATLEEVRRQFASGKYEVSRGPNPSRERDPTQVQAEVTIIGPDGKRKHLLYRAQYVYSLEGRPKITGLLVDMTDRKDAEERLSVIAKELQHRVKNSLTLVQSLARLSLRPEALDRDSVDRFLNRLNALAAATNLVLGSSVGGADLRDVIGSIIRPYRDDNHDPFLVSGPAVSVSPRAASAFSLVLHELCTNAVKYGALSDPNGTVEIAWEMGADQSFLLTWREMGGPTVSPPSRAGFGSRLISALVEGDLKGTLARAYLSKGIEVTMSAHI